MVIATFSVPADQSRESFTHNSFIKDYPVSGIGTVARVAESSSATAEQVSASTQETSASAEEISASAQELSATAQALEQFVGRFTV
jgi:methyl-accepting chemotaxis protein